MKSFKQFINEDGAAAVAGGPTNAVGGGAIAGTGSGPDKKSAEPPGRKNGFKPFKPLVKRLQPKLV